MKRSARIAYWVITSIIAWEMVAGSMWDLLQIEFTRGVFDRLHYPHYLLFIIGAWKLPCAIVWLVPRFPRLKEWAYAGGFFNYTGAAASHLLAHDRTTSAIGPAVFAAMTIASWALRPPERRLPKAEPQTTSVVAWAIPVAVLVVMLVLALLTLPKGPPPA
jgi:hypothetical protein